MDLVYHPKIVYYMYKNPTYLRVNATREFSSKFSDIFIFKPTESPDKWYTHENISAP